MGEDVSPEEECKQEEEEDPRLCHNGTVCPNPHGRETSHNEGSRGQGMR